MIASLVCRFRYRQFIAACRDPLTAQTARLRCVLRQASGTVIGRQHGFNRLSKLSDSAMIRGYQERIPIRTHRDMSADLDAVYQGDWSRLCPSPPLYFSMTAGSTGAFKYLPVTAEFRREVGQGSMIFNGALEAAFPGLRHLKSQFLVGSAEGGQSPAGLAQGFASGLNYKHLPWLVRRKFSVPYWIFTLDDADERNYAAGRVLVAERRLGALCAISPVNLINLRRALEENPERLISDVRSGQLTVRGRSTVEGTYRTRPDPVRSERLRRAWDATGTLPNRLLFPSLQVLVSWQGGNMSYYLGELQQAFGLDQRFEFPISSSEGLFAIPCEPNRAGGALAITSHFLEFLPDVGGVPPDAPALRADQLTNGAQYRIVLTTGAGLYRYDMEDIVRVRGYCAATPIIEFVCKSDRQVSVANERLTELDVTVATTAASEVSGFHPREFLFVPCRDRRYRVVVDGLALGPEVQGFENELERQLRRTAKGYDFEREDDLLAPLEVVATAPGELRNYLRRQATASPLPNAQTKPLHLTNQFDLHETFTTETQDGV